MIKVTNEQIAKFLGASAKLEEVELDDERGDIAAALHAECTVKHLAYQYRARSLEKERKKLVNDHAQHDAKGGIKYGESPDGKAETRPVIWKNATAWTKAIEAWQEKMEAVNNQVVELSHAPVRDDYFKKPAEILVKHGIRVGFIPLMATYQNALKAAKKGKK